MRVPTAADLLSDSIVREALDNAWADSQSNDPGRRHEEGGWVYMDTATGTISIRRARAGRRALLNLNDLPLIAGSVVVATFHTHPNPIAEGWNPEPSANDEQSAWLLGVPCFVRAEDGVHSAGPDARRGGLRGGPGFPA